MQQCTRRRLVVDTLGFMRLQKTEFWLSKGRDIVFILPKNSLLFAFIINSIFFAEPGLPGLPVYAYICCLSQTNPPKTF